MNFSRSAIRCGHQRVLIRHGHDYASGIWVLVHHHFRVRPKGHADDSDEFVFELHLVVIWRRDRSVRNRGTLKERSLARASVRESAGGAMVSAASAPFACWPVVAYDTVRLRNSV